MWLCWINLAIFMLGNLMLVVWDLITNLNNWIVDALSLWLRWNVSCSWISWEVWWKNLSCSWRSSRISWCWRGIVLASSNGCIRQVLSQRNFSRYISSTIRKLYPSCSNARTCLSSCRKWAVSDLIYLVFHSDVLIHLIHINSFSKIDSDR